MAAVSWKDDANIIAWGNTTEENCENLEAIYAKCKNWEETHASRFNLTKYSLIHMTSKYKKANMNRSVRLED